MSHITTMMQNLKVDTYVGDCVDSVANAWRKYAKPRVSIGSKELKICTECNSTYDKMGRLEDFPRTGLLKVGICKECKRGI